MTIPKEMAPCGALSVGVGPRPLRRSGNRPGRGWRAGRHSASARSRHRSWRRRRRQAGRPCPPRALESELAASGLQGAIGGPGCRAPKPKGALRPSSASAAWSPPSGPP